MNATSLALIKLGLDALITLWAQHANKPPGWTPSPADWQSLRDEVAAATPEAMLEEAKRRLAAANGATTAIEARD